VTVRGKRNCKRYLSVKREQLTSCTRIVVNTSGIAAWSDIEAQLQGVFLKQITIGMQIRWASCSQGKTFTLHCANIRASVERSQLPFRWCFASAATKWLISIFRGFPWQSGISCGMLEERFGRLKRGTNCCRCPIQLLFDAGVFNASCADNEHIDLQLCTRSL